MRRAIGARYFCMSREKCPRFAVAECAAIARVVPFAASYAVHRNSIDVAIPIAASFRGESHRSKQSCRLLSFPQFFPQAIIEALSLNPGLCEDCHETLGKSLLLFVCRGIGTLRRLTLN
jgi:hypothetical protein